MKKKFRFVLKVLCVILAVFLVIQILPTKDGATINPFMKSANDSKISVATKDGCGEVFPQNVLSAFSSGVSMGCDTFYIGVCMTSDEQLIVSNSTELADVSNGSGEIEQTTYEEISKLNFAYNYIDEDGVQLYKDRVLSPILLSELLGKYKYANYIIEIIQPGKTGRRAAELLCEMIRSMKMSTQIIIYAPVEDLTIVRENENVDIFTAASDWEQGLFKVLSTTLLSNLYFGLDFQAVFIEPEDLGKVTTYLYMWALQKRNVCVYVKDVNDEETYHKAAIMGVDGVITSHPEIIIPLTVEAEEQEE